MRYLIIFFICLFGSLRGSNAQNRFQAKPLRYNDTHNSKVLDSNSSLLDKIKFISLSKHGSLNTSLGGELRLQYQYFRNENWGDIPTDDNGFLLNRGLLHLNTRYKKNLRMFAQLQSSSAFSRINPSPLDKNQLDLHQLFMDLCIKANLNEITIRVGRQEFLYGSQRLISVREGPNSRLSFDAIKLIWNSNQVDIDAFYANPIINKYGSFNDASSNTKLYGVYGILKKVPIIENIDIYYLGFNRQKAVYNNISGSESRHSIGARIWSSDYNWNYDFEALGQFGSIADQSIFAWTASIKTTYQDHTLNLKPKFIFKSEMISGDRSPFDNINQTFNPLFPRGAYFGMAALLGPSNLFDLHPSVEIELNNKLNFGVDYGAFWRLSKADGIYQPNTILLYPSSNSTLKSIGDQFGAFMGYEPKNGISLKLEFTWFQPGNYLRQVSSGRDILFTATTLQYQF